MSQSTSTTALTQIVNWLAFGFRVPEDWEIVRHSVDFARGSLVFVDRVRQRLSVSWTACARAPDLDRLLTDFERAPRSAGETALDQEDCAGFRLLTCQTPSGDRVSHALCFDPLSNRLLELELPDSGASGAGALTRALLASFVFSGPEHPACVRAFGLHAELPSGFRLRRSQVKPADVSLEFTRPSQREGRSEDRLRIRRSGMARTWFDGDAARALRLRNPELVCADFEAVAVGPHAAVAAQAWPRGSVLQRALGRVAPRRVTVWACPAQNAVFETEIHARRGADAEGLEPPLWCCLEHAQEPVHGS